MKEAWSSASLTHGQAYHKTSSTKLLINGLRGYMHAKNDGTSLQMSLWISTKLKHSSFRAITLHNVLFPQLPAVYPRCYLKANKISKSEGTGQVVLTLVIFGSVLMLFAKNYQNFQCLWKLQLSIYGTFLRCRLIQLLRCCILNRLESIMLKCIPLCNWLCLIGLIAEYSILLNIPCFSIKFCYNDSAMAQWFHSSIYKRVVHLLLSPLSVTGRVWKDIQP